MRDFSLCDTASPASDVLKCMANTKLPCRALSFRRAFCNSAPRGKKGEVTKLNSILVTLNERKCGNVVYVSRVAVQ